jgi:hypothetical protein
MTLHQLVERERARMRTLVALQGVLAALAFGALLLALGIVAFGGARWIALPAALPVLLWIVAIAGIAAVWWHTRRAIDVGASRSRIAEAIEREGSLRRGAVRGALEVGDAGALGARGAAIVAGQLAARGPVLAPTLRRDAGRRGLLAGVGAFVLLLAATGTGWAWPDGWRAMAHPVAAWRGTLLPPLRIDAPGAIVRGERLTLQVEAPGRRTVTLQSRARGRAWSRTAHAVRDGWATVTLPPLDADLVLVAHDGRAASDTVQVRVADRPFVGDVAIRAMYPAYLGRQPEPLAAGETMRLPQGTVLQVQGRASARLRSVVLAQGPTELPLDAAGQRFAGRVPARAGRWEWRAAGIAGPIADLPPALELEIVPDSAPTIAITHPGADTTITPNDRVMLAIVAGDDHGLAQVSLRAWKVGADGRAGAAVVTPLANSGDGHWSGDVPVDAAAYGLVPGEALHLVAEARDASPWSQRTESAPVVLRIPNLAEQRQLARNAADSTVAAAVAAASAQKQLAQRTNDAARSRGERSNSGNQQAQPRSAEAQAQAPSQASRSMSFENAEKARALAREQRELGAKVEQLRESARQLEKQLRQAGAMDSALQQRLREAQDLLRDALTPELQERLRQLEEAAQKMQADASRSAMSELAEQQQRMREALEKSVEMLRRAALEGAMETLKDDAKELASRQRALGDSLSRADDGAQQRERAGRDSGQRSDAQAKQLAARTEKIAEQIAQLEERLRKEQAQSGAERAAQAGQHARESAKDMARAADAKPRPADERPRVDEPADLNRRDGAEVTDRAKSPEAQSGARPSSEQNASASRQSGAKSPSGSKAGQQSGQRGGEKPSGDQQRADAANDAAKEMDDAAQRLAEAREQQISEWKEELTQELDRAIQETLQLARQEEDIAQQVQETGNSAEARAQQSSVQQGTKQAGDRVDQAGRKSSHLSGRTQRAMQDAEKKVAQATEQANEGGNSSQRTAQSMREAASALNQAAASMVRDRERANSASSASGFSEMLEQLRQSAKQQGQLNQQAAGMAMGQAGSGANGAGGRQLARQQREIARALEEAGEGNGEGAGRAQALAKEAEEIARQMERQGVDPATLERQQRLYRKLLDAGRAMEQDDRDETGKREARAADGEQQFAPGAAANGRPATKFREPTWAELRGLTAEERRLVLEYFKRINATP